MDRVKNAARSTKNFVKRYQTLIAVATTIAVLVYVQTRIMGAHNDFLEEHGLLDEFYAVDLEI